MFFGIFMNICPFTNILCSVARRNGGRCIDVTSNADPSICIKNLSSVIEELNKEIADLDDLLDNYKNNRKPN
jgi:hypothetical protein